MKDDIFEIWENVSLSSGKWSHYFEIYDELLSEYRGKKITFVEIGVKDGGSLLFFREYLGQEARIIGIDIDPRTLGLKGDFEIKVGDQGDPGFWSEFFKEIGRIDILLDDGSHQINHQITTLEMSIAHMSGGVIIIEDTQSNFRPDFNDGSSYTLYDHISGISRIMTLRSLGETNPNYSFSLDPALIPRYRHVKKISMFQNIISLNLDGFLVPGVEIQNKKMAGGEMNLPAFNSSMVRDLRDLSIAKYVETPNLNPRGVKKLTQRLRKFC